MSYGWNESPTKAECTIISNGRHVYKIGAYTVGVLAPDDVTYTHNYRHRSDGDRGRLPNMEISDGQITIPISDLVGEMMSRLEPVDLARALWENDDVRAAFVECMIDRYSDGVKDADRRNVLAGLKGAIHSTDQERLAGSMAKIEHELSRMHYRAVSHYDTNRAIEALEERLRERYPGEAISIPRFGNDQNNPISKIGGVAWDAARDYWRSAVLQQFPAPPPELEIPTVPATLESK